MKRIFFLLGCLLATQSQGVDYQREIAPILRSYCAGCHNDKDLDGDLSFETYAALRKGGEKGDPLANGDKGPLLLRVIEATGKSKMPPKDEPQLPAEELATLKRWIAAGGPGPAEDVPLFKALTVPRTAPMPGVRHPITAASLSPDGRLLAVGQGNTVELRNPADQSVVRRLEGFPGKVNAVHFSPDGQRLATASGIAGLNGTAQLWRVEDGKLLHDLGGASDVLYDAEFSPDGKILATAGYDRVIRLYDADAGKLLRAIDIHKGAIFDLAFHPSGKLLASASADATVKLWRTSDGVRLDTLNQPISEQTAVLFTRDGRHVISAGADKRIHIWHLIFPEQPGINPLLLARFAHEAPVTGLTGTADGKWLISSADDRSLKLWSLPELIERHAWAAQPSPAQILVSNPQGGFVVGRMDGTVATFTIPMIAEPPPLPAANLIATEAAQGSLAEAQESEPNNVPAEAATTFTVPVKIRGALQQEGDGDLFRFRAAAGQRIVLDVDAESSGSKIDSRIEVLTAGGQPVEQVVLQAVKDSWFTFRGKDSTTTDDFRVQNWSEMELNEYLYCNGEVVKLWLYPRGPDSGFRVYPGLGNRHTFFQTTPHAHALGEPCYIVQPMPPGSEPPPNGLPTFRLNYENDDEPSGKRGSDSLLMFTAPANGEYLARITDVRGYGGEKEHHYTLTIREPRPSYTVSIGGRDPKISPGSGRELAVNVTRSEGFDGPIEVHFSNVPAGFKVTSPVIVEAGQSHAFTGIYAAADAVAPDEAMQKKVTVTAKAIIDGKEVQQTLGDLGKIQLAPKPKITAEIVPSQGEPEPGKPVVLTVRPGETVTARVRVQRHDFENRVQFGNDDSGRNLPHGVYVDNIGLNGLLIVEGQSEREFSITAAPIAQPTERLFHLKAKEDGDQVSAPAIIRVLPRAPQAQR